eukprot:4752317-Alexandrium_andersonii.AAC.1
MASFCGSAASTRAIYQRCELARSFRRDLAGIRWCEGGKAERFGLPQRPASVAAAVVSQSSRSVGWCALGC